MYASSSAVMKTGTSPPNANWCANDYRLPAEAEWGNATRCGLSEKRFPWDATHRQSQANHRTYSGDIYDLSDSDPISFLSFSGPISRPISPPLVTVHSIN